MGVRVRQKQKGGPWWVFVAHGGRRKSKRVGSRDAARKLAKEIEGALAAHDLGLFRDDETDVAPVTFGEFVSEVFLPRIERTRKPSTVRDYRCVLGSERLVMLNNRPIGSIARTDVISLEDYFGRLGLSERNITKHLHIVSSVFSEALRRELIQFNPAQLALRGRKRPKPNPQPLSRSEVTALLQTLKKDRYEDARLKVRTMLDGGLRPGEMVTLQWGDVLWKRSAIHVQRALSDTQVLTPKNGSDRVVFVTQELMHALRDLYAARFGKVVPIDEEARIDQVGGSLRAWVFSNTEGGIMDLSNFRSRVWDPLCAEAGIGAKQMKQLRHTHAALLGDLGKPAKFIQQQLGHHSAGFTLDVYAGILPGEHEGPIDLGFTAPVCTLSAPDGVCDNQSEGSENEKPSEIQRVLLTRPA